MSISPGFTVSEVREFVLEYQRQPQGLKGPWLVARDVSYWRLRKWRDAVFEGDLDRGLVPREGSPMSVPSSSRTSIARARASERAAHDAEVAKLNARVRELEQTNEALGKAIGLLHSMSEQEPVAGPTTTDPSNFSTPRTGSSPT